MDNVYEAILKSHEYCWGNIGLLENILKMLGWEIEELENNNRADGEYHKRIKRNGKDIDVSANIYRAETFKLLWEYLGEECK